MVTVVKVGGSLLKLGLPENILSDFCKALQEEKLVQSMEGDLKSPR